MAINARKIVPVPYAQVETDTATFHVYADSRVLKYDYDHDGFMHYQNWEDDYDEILAAGLEVLK